LGQRKTDAIDTRKILELFQLKDQLPLTKDVLQKVVKAPVVNEKLKRLSRRRRQLVSEKIKVAKRKYAGIIQEWQRKANFSSEVDYVGPMIIQDARRLLELLEQIHALNKAMEELTMRSRIARRLSSLLCSCPQKFSG